MLLRINKDGGSKLKGYQLIVDPNKPMGNKHGKGGDSHGDEFLESEGGTSGRQAPTDSKFSISEARRLYAHLKQRRSPSNPEYLHDRILVFSYEESSHQGHKGVESSSEEDAYLDCLQNASKFLQENHADATLLINLSTNVFMNPGKYSFSQPSTFVANCAPLHQQPLRNT